MRGLLNHTKVTAEEDQDLVAAKFNENCECIWYTDSEILPKVTINILIEDADSIQFGEILLSLCFDFIDYKYKQIGKEGCESRSSNTPLKVCDKKITHCNMKDQSKDLRIHWKILFANQIQELPL